VTDVPARRIVAVVVTFNRLALLQRLVSRLLEVGGLAEILVVDNASTDGTAEWLAAQAAPVSTLSLPDNRGGAGGFDVGVRAAYDGGADLIWLMDDDGIPEPDCLKILLDHDEYDFWGPAVLAEQDPSRLCFPIRLPGRAAVVRRDHLAPAAPRRGRARPTMPRGRPRAPRDPRSTEPSARRSRGRGTTAGGARAASVIRGRRR
jgi:rhamnopyranosyl-N-acetylglucosaminyl-diphospho-decaprenol beta-1,3/1,4-galactofuranosyltransferase